MNNSAVVVAGATGNLGGRIVRALLERRASVRALVRQGTARDRLERLQTLGATIASVDLDSASQVASACSRASCIVSALQGLRDVIVETQTVLLDAAIQAEVPRFIPSDYSIDFTKLRPGENRNLDLHGRGTVPVQLQLVSPVRPFGQFTRGQQEHRPGEGSLDFLWRHSRSLRLLIEVKVTGIDW